MAPGLKYLMNNKQPPKPSNLADITNGRDEINQKQMESQYPANIRNAPKEKLRVNERYRERKSILREQSAPVNDRQRAGLKDESNNIYLVNKNPATDDSVHKDRFKIKRRDPETTERKSIPVNGSQQGGSIIRSNNKYLVNKNPGIVSYARRDNSDNTSENNSEGIQNTSIAGKEYFPVKDKNSSIQKNHDNDTNPEIGAEPQKKLQGEPAILIQNT